jgi:CheY-like chemotaxis protein/HPt (histidine-containing phosphotransfer) domain-containing protein
MTDNQLNGLFQSFTQADSSTTRKFGGTGLGLTICKQLVTMMDGEIRVTSQPEKGSTFTFTLRLGTTDMICASRSCQEADPNAVAAIRGSRILVVDDNLLNQQVVQELLTMESFAVTTASNGHEAVKTIRKKVFDAVLMDIHMPVMDGLAATREIRNDLRFNTLPIIAMTASAMAADRQMGFSAGMSAYITKPIDPERLLQVLVRWIPARQQPGSALPAHAAVSDTRQLPANLPGINIQVGLRWTTGNESLLRKLMEQFYRKHSRDLQTIRQALENDEQEKAQRIAHTAKGVAGTIGALKLQQAATAVDAALKTNNREKLPLLLEKMEKALLEVLSGLQLLHVSANSPQKSGAGDQLNMDSLVSMLTRVKILVHELDPDAEEVALNLRQALHGSSFYETANLLHHQIEETEFDAAEETLKQLQSALQASEKEENIR